MYILLVEPISNHPHSILLFNGGAAICIYSRLLTLISVASFSANLFVAEKMCVSLSAMNLAALSSKIRTSLLFLFVWSFSSYSKPISFTCSCHSENSKSYQFVDVNWVNSKTNYSLDRRYVSILTYNQLVNNISRCHSTVKCFFFLFWKENWKFGIKRTSHRTFLFDIFYDANSFNMHLLAT